MVVARDGLSAVRRECGGELPATRRTEQRPATHDDHTGHQEGQHGPAQDVDGERAGRVGDRRLRAGEELDVALEVLTQHLDGPRRVDGGHRPRDLLDDHLDAERQRERRVDLDRAERARGRP